MDEQSHKDEMRAALQGDFERLRARRDDLQPGEAPLFALQEELQDDPPGDAIATPAAEPEPVAGSRSWLARLRGR